MSIRKTDNSIIELERSIRDISGYYSGAHSVLSNSTLGFAVQQGS